MTIRPHDVADLDDEVRAMEARLAPETMRESDLDFVKSMTKGSVHVMVKSVLTTGMRAVDVGAAVGEITQTMRECVGPTGHLTAIEPRETVIAGAPDVVHRVACGETHTTWPLYLGSPPTMSSLYREAVPGAVKAPNAQYVHVERLDDLVDAADLVKLDVQGGEVNVLRGARHLLTVCPAWILEVWPAGLLASGRSLANLWALFAGAGLTPYDVLGREISDSHAVTWLSRITRPTTHANWIWRR